MKIRAQSVLRQNQPHYDIKAGIGEILEVIRKPLEITIKAEYKCTIYEVRCTKEKNYFYCLHLQLRKGVTPAPAPPPPFQGRFLHDSPKKTSQANVDRISSFRRASRSPPR